MLILQTITCQFKTFVAIKESNRKYVLIYSLYIGESWNSELHLVNVIRLFYIRYFVTLTCNLFPYDVGRMSPINEKNQVAGIAVVPLMGYPVDIAASQILTNAWLVTFLILKICSWIFMLINVLFIEVKGFSFDFTQSCIFDEYLK